MKIKKIVDISMVLEEDLPSDPENSNSAYPEKKP